MISINTDMVFKNLFGQLKRTQINKVQRIIGYQMRFQEKDFQLNLKAKNTDRKSANHTVMLLK